MAPHIRSHSEAEIRRFTTVDALYNSMYSRNVFTNAQQITIKVCNLRLRYFTSAQRVPMPKIKIRTGREQQQKTICSDEIVPVGNPRSRLRADTFL